MTHSAKVTLNTASLLVTIAVNVWASAAGIFDNTVGEVSAKYETLITPAGYAFSIWSLIYLGLIAFVGFQWYEIKKNVPEIRSDAGLWLTWANVANALWLLVWLKEYTSLSVFIMFFLLFALIKVALKLNMERWDAPLRIIVFVWWPITFYIGWIVLASVTNVAAYLVSIGWDSAPVTMTIVMIGVATAIYVFLTFTRNMRETCLVGIWGLIAVAVKHGGTHSPIFYAVFVACAVLFFVASFHGFKNRETSPMKKWQRKEI